MKKNNIFCGFLVERRHWLLGLMLVLAVVCGVMVPRVNVNTDMTKYLPRDSEMKKGLDRMKDELGQDAANMLSVRAMYKGLTREEKDSVRRMLAGMEDVEMVTSVEEKGEYVLYDMTIVTNGDPKGVAREIRNGEKEVVVETSIDGNLPDVSVFLIAGLLVFVILFLMCESWMEPLLFLATIGVAVVMNVGSNVLLESVSMTTNAIVAILQLVLSMDYSIILMNRYRQEVERMRREGTVDKKAAMKKALQAASPSVLSSALTTMAGLLMLCFMKFRIGMDLGIVLAKGVVCSVVCLYGVLPSLVLLFDKAIEKSRKRVVVPNTDRLARFESRNRYALAVVGVAVFGVAFWLHNKTEISFSTNWPTEISEVFPRKNTVVLLYRNEDESKIGGLTDALGLDVRVDTVVSYPSLMQRQMNAEEMCEGLKGMTAMMGEEVARMVDSMLTPEMLEMVFGLMNTENVVPDGPVVELPELPEMPKENSDVAEVLEVEQEEVEVEAVEDSAKVAGTEGRKMVKKVERVYVPSLYDTVRMRMTAQKMSAYLGFDGKQAATLYRMSGRAKGEMTPIEFVHYVTDKILTNRMYASFISVDQRQQLERLKQRMDSAYLAQPKMVEVVTEIAMESTESDSGAVAMGDNSISVALDTMKTVVVESKETPRVERVIETAVVTEEKRVLTCSLEEMVDFMTGELLENEEYAEWVNEEMRGKLTDVSRMMDEGIGKMKGKEWSMAAIVTSYADEGDETHDFLKRLRQCCKEELEGEYALIGESVMFDEMREGFGKELLLLTILTVLAIFLIVALTFRSVLLPVLLVITVMSGVYVNVFISGMGGRTMLYLAYLIVQSILMGATIDYAILFANYYIEGRRTRGVSEALETAYRGSIRTILTSGLIIVLAPGVMSFLVEDHTISSIVGCLSVGGLAVIVLILFVLPGSLAAFDRFVSGHKGEREDCREYSRDGDGREVEK